MAGGMATSHGLEGQRTHISKRRGSGQVSLALGERATRPRLSSSESSGADSFGTQSEDRDSACDECDDSAWTAGVTGLAESRRSEGECTHTEFSARFQRAAGRGLQSKWNCAHCGKPRRVISIPRRRRRMRGTRDGIAGSNALLQGPGGGGDETVEIVSNVGPMLKEMEENLAEGDKRLEEMMQRSLKRTMTGHSDTRYTMNDSINTMDVEELNAAVSSVTSVLHKIDLHNPNAREELKQSLWPVLVRHCFGTQRVPRNVHEAALGEWGLTPMPTGSAA